MCSTLSNNNLFMWEKNVVEEDDDFHRPSTSQPASVMSTLASVGPMLIMDGAAGGQQPNGVPLNMNLPQQHPNAYFSQMPPQFNPQFMAFRGGHPLMPPQPPHLHMGNNQPSSTSTPTPSTTSLNRSQRCGVCRGCQCKPCGNCTYCQDSPQFGGPGVKKQSCVERRCLRVLENRLQRDAPTFKARMGCNNCEDCKMPDCQTCLVCLDKRFFENRYMTGALCAKKRCNNATSLELNANQNNNDRNTMKRAYDHSNNFDYGGAKRRMDLMGPNLSNGLMNNSMMSQQRPNMMSNMMGQDPYGQARLQGLHILPQPPQMNQMKYAFQQIPQNNFSLLMPMNPPNSLSDSSLMSQNMNLSKSMDNSSVMSNSSSNPSPPTSQNCNSTMSSTSVPSSTAPTSLNSSNSMYTFSSLGGVTNCQGFMNLPYATAPPSVPCFPNVKMDYNNVKLDYPNVRTDYNNVKLDYEPFKDMHGQLNDTDPFTPPSYAAETKSAVILQPL